MLSLSEKGEGFMIAKIKHTHKPQRKKELQALRKMPDSKIDTSDIPELDWSKAEQGRFYRKEK